MPFHHAIVTGLATSRGQQKHPNEVGPHQSAALRSDRRVGQIKMPPDPATQTPAPLQNAEPGPLQLAEINLVSCSVALDTLSEMVAASPAVRAVPYEDILCQRHPNPGSGTFCVIWILGRR